MFKLNEKHFNNFIEVEGQLTQAFYLEGKGGVVFLAKCGECIVIDIVNGGLNESASIAYPPNLLSLRVVKRIANEYLSRESVK